MGKKSTSRNIEERHGSLVADLADRIRLFHDEQKPFRIYHGSTTSTRTPPYKRDNIVDTSKLTNILEIDGQGALVEPNVSMGRLVEATMKYGFIPTVVPEFPAITVGGAFAGTAGESSSCRHGLFDESVSWIEVILGDGSIIAASKEDNIDLLRGAAGTCGTLGVITLLRIDLMPAKKYTELTYVPVQCANDALAEMQNCFAEPRNLYIDGVMFRKDFGVIMAGRLMDDINKDVPIRTFRGARDDWFFQHAQKACQRTSGSFKVAIPIVDYLFRWDRGAFWGGLLAFRYFLMPFNRLTRFLLDPFMHTKTMWHAFLESGLANSSIAQDMGVPFERTEEFLQYLHNILHLYPLWLCPIRHKVEFASSFHLHCRKIHSETLVNVGIWGLGPKDPVTFRSLNRDLESKCHDLGGYKVLYARTYYSEDEFWAIYDRKGYMSLREKYKASTLPTLYDKVKAPEPRQEEAAPSWKNSLKSSFWSIWPFSGLYGVFCVIVGSDYLFKEAT